MKRMLAAAVAGLLVAVAAPGHAATYTIAMKDPATFEPKSRTAAMGSTFVFVNKGDLTHGTRLAPQAIPWNVRLDADESWTKTLRYAGRYAYYCDLHASSPADSEAMVGSISIPVRVGPTSGTTATTFTIRVATVNAPSGYVYDVQRKRGSGDWVTWKSSIKSATSTFKTSTRGTYYFRSRLRWTTPSPDRATGWSPAKGLTVG